MFPEQATDSSSHKVANANVHSLACATEEFSMQKGEDVKIAEHASQAPSFQTEPIRFDGHGIHTPDMAQNMIVSEGNRNFQNAEENPSHTQQNTSSHLIDAAPSVQHTDPALPPIQGALPTSTPLLLTLENSNEGTCVQQPSKEIVKVSTNEDGNKKLTSFDSPRVLPSVGAFTVQCALCMKWRLIPTKEQYEEIRESVLEKPFFCSSAASWRPDVSCEDPSDVLQDESHLWAIDRPNIPVAPPGWERQLVIRAAGASKFADVYYVAPSGRKLRSMPELERFLAEFPEYVQAGIRTSQFSFIIPRPLDSNYCRKKSTGASALNVNGVGSQKASSTNKGKKPQGRKLSAKRKAFESLSSKEDLEELDSLKKTSGVAEKSFKGSGMNSSYDDMISQQVVKGSLPPEELMKGLFWPEPGHPDHSSLETSQLPSNVAQSEAHLQGK